MVCLDLSILDCSVCVAALFAVEVPAPDGVVLPAGSFLAADGTVYDRKSMRVLGRVVVPGAQTGPSPAAAAAAPAPVAMVRGSLFVVVVDAVAGELLCNPVSLPSKQGS
jgi:hypothetical protein